MLIFPHRLQRFSLAAIFVWLLLNSSAITTQHRITYLLDSGKRLTPGICGISICELGQLPQHGYKHGHKLFVVNAAW